MTNNGDIKGEFGSVIPPHSGTHLATSEKGFGGGVAVRIVAFLSSIIGLNMIKLFQAPAISTDTIYDIDFIGSADQVPAPNIPNCNYDFDFKKEKEREVKGFEYDIGYGIKYGTGRPLITTQNIILKFFGKEREKGFIFGKGAAQVSIMTGFLYCSSGNQKKTVETFKLNCNLL